MIFINLFSNRITIKNSIFQQADRYHLTFLMGVYVIYKAGSIQ